MFGHTFYHGLIRKYVALFGTLFNEVYINRPNPDSNIINTIKVPISYGPSDKTLARLDSDPSLNRMPAITLPRMAFEIDKISYASERKLPTVNRSKSSQISNDPDKLAYLYNPVPYDIDFSLYIMVKNTDDGTRIIEQILPFFTPEWTVTAQLITDPNVIMDIPVILTGVTMSDDYEDDFEKRRVLMWTLTFTLKGYLFGPKRKSSVIKFANTNLYTTMTANTAAVNINIRPGLDANGNSTTVANDSIDATLIDVNDDFGYIVTITDN